MISPTRRVRVTIPALELEQLRWLAGESGNELADEARLLLVSGIRMAVRRYRKLYKASDVSPADLETLKRENADLGWRPEPIGGIRGREHPLTGTLSPNVGDPPLWGGGFHELEEPNPQRERGFAGHGQEEEK